MYICRQLSVPVPAKIHLPNSLQERADIPNQVLIAEEGHAEGSVGRTGLYPSPRDLLWGSRGERVAVFGVIGTEPPVEGRIVEEMVPDHKSEQTSAPVVSLVHSRPNRRNQTKEYR